MDTSLLSFISENVKQGLCPFCWEHLEEVTGTERRMIECVNYVPAGPGISNPSKTKCSFRIER